RPSSLDVRDGPGACVPGRDPGRCVHRHRQAGKACTCCRPFSFSDFLFAARGPRLSKMNPPDTTLTRLTEEAHADFAAAGTPAALEDAKARYLGKSGRVT